MVRQAESEPAAAASGERAATASGERATAASGERTAAASSQPAAVASGEPASAASGERASAPEREPGEEAEEGFDSEQWAEKAVQALKRSRENGSLEVWRYLSDNYEKMPIVSKSVYEYSWGAFEIDVKKKTFSVSYRGGDLVNIIRGEFVGENENEWRINLVLK